MVWFRLFINIELNFNLIHTLSVNEEKKLSLVMAVYVQGVFFNWYPPKKLKYGKPRLDVSTLT